MDPKLVSTYRLFKKMMQHPALFEQMQSFFLAALDARGIATRDSIETEAREQLQAANIEASADNLETFRGTLIAYYFATHFSEAEIDDHINLTRKYERFQNLQKVVNSDGVTSRKIRQALREFCALPQGDLFISGSEAEGVRVALLDHFVSSQLPFISIAKEFISIRDVDEMLDHSVWSARPGRIGGKAAGMVLAYKILLPRLTARDPELERYVRTPESYYFDSGILEEFINHNELHWLHSVKYKDPDHLEGEYRKVRDVFDQAHYPTELVAKFRAFLQQIGEHPLILRSSSLLEDNFGYAFSGKYESVFLANQGALETRLQDFIAGMKRVHVSTLAPAPILYRRDHNLLDFDEQMSVLVQKVVGRRVGDGLFLPFAAGVAFSYNPYHWTSRIRKEDGLVRLVLGLGTRAVERVSQDYPRMIPLSHPKLRPEVSPEQIHKYSQKLVDVLNLSTARVESHSYLEILDQLSPADVHLAVAVMREGHLGPPPFKGYPVEAQQTCLTFDNFLGQTPFVALMKTILKRLEKAYRRPVDVEFAWDDNQLYVLQCRTLPMRHEPHHVALPTGIAATDVLFTNDQGVAGSIVRDLEFIVYVDPKAYQALPSVEEKVAIGRVVGKINRFLGGKRYALLGPGRWGSNDINLGVRVTYADIHRSLILGEIAFEEDGATPEASYGTHFFSDLVEAGIIPIAIYPDRPGTVFNQAFLLQTPNLLPSILPDLAACAPVVHVIHVPTCTSGRLLQIYQSAQEQKGMGFFAHAGGLDSENIQDPM
jgi:hypothetical protein